MTACIVLSIFREIKIQKKHVNKKRGKIEKTARGKDVKDRKYMRAKRKIELLYMRRLRHRVLQKTIYGRRSRDDVGFNERI